VKRIVSKLLLVFSILVTLSIVGCGNVTDSEKNNVQNKSNEIIVSAAASLKDSLTELQKAYTQKNPQVKVTLNFGGSGTLQQQIEQGAPADLFISAGQAQVDSLDQKNLLVKESIVNLVGNDLVLILKKDNQDILSVQDLVKANVEQISIGTPESVPAGKYAQESLTYLNLWDTLKPKFVLAKDVTQVLNYVETGNVEAGIVYKSDAQSSTQVKVVEVLSATSHQPILYPAGVVAATKNKEAAGEFLTYLQSPEAQQIFVNYGFSSIKK
jgi:molybdate transport system substrate-binding protein